MSRYNINESFYSLAGEGLRAGEPSIYCRFAGCNMRCDIEPGPLSPGFFRCDTEFVSSTAWTIEQLIAEFQTLGPKCKWVVLTGGEPTQQLDAELIEALKSAGYKLAIETNGTSPVLPGIDWITVSPKVAEHAVQQRTANEVKYVRAYGQGIPRTVVKADYYLISPAFSGTELDRRNLDWCIKLCLENPPWRLTMQSHKIWAVR